MEVKRKANVKRFSEAIRKSSSYRIGVKKELLNDLMNDSYFIATERLDETEEIPVFNSRGKCLKAKETISLRIDREVGSMFGKKLILVD